MKGLAFLGQRQVAMIDVEDPAPGPGDVIVEMKASGMCGSDLHRYRGAGAPQVIAGHEPCGIVAEVGSAVPPSIRIGDRVMIHHYFGCSSCEQCRTGWPQLCKPATRAVYSVSAGAHGGHAPYMKVRASSVMQLDEGLSFEAGAAIGCGTGTAWGGLERLQMKGDEVLAIFGQGPVGVSGTMLASARGARVIAVDLDEQRLSLAKSFGAWATVNASKVDAAGAIRELTGGKGAQLALETSGSSQAVTAALNCAAVWGKVALVGIGSTVNFEFRAFLDRQLTLLTSYSMSSVGQMECADFIVQRKLDVDRLFSDRWRLDQAEEAYLHFDKQTSGKGVFVF